MINSPLKMSANLTGNVKSGFTKNISNQNEKEKGKPTILKIGRVYIITNLINNKKYVGITTQTIEKRFKQHIYARGGELFPISRAIKKYGKQHFTIKLIEELHNIGEEELLSKESFYINKYSTLVDGGRGYNLMESDGKHLIFSQTTKKKMSNSKKGILNINYGKCYTEIEKGKMALANPRIDLTVRKFRNTFTNEEFKGNRHVFRQKYNLTKPSIKAFIQGRLKTLKGWVLVKA